MGQDAMDQWLQLQPVNVKNGMTVRTSEEVGPLYHMSLDGGIDKFTPYITRRTSMKENISVPRVSTAPSIMGCFIGYMASWNDISSPDLKNKKHKNGWYLYEIPYEHCIKPDKKLLFDQEHSDEHWLVTYSPETRDYRPKIVAKMFYAEMTIVPVAGKLPDYRAKLLVEVLAEEGILLGGEKTLSKGTWVIEGPVLEDHRKWDDLKPYSIYPISYAQYSVMKGHAASMLSAAEPKTFKDIFHPFVMPEEGREEANMGQVSNESVIGTVARTLGIGSGSHLKHLHEAKRLLRMVHGQPAFKNSATTVVSKLVAAQVRPDEAFCKDPVSYCQDVLSFLKDYHSDSLWPSGSKFIDQAKETLRDLDYSSHEAFKASVKQVAKALPQSPLDKLPAKSRNLVAPGDYLRVFQEKDHTFEDMIPFPECHRFWKPSQLIFASYSDNKRKPYKGDGQLPALTPDQIAKVLTIYIEAEKYFAIAKKLESRPWPAFGSRGAQIARVYGSDNDYKIWSKYSRDKDVLTTYASYKQITEWQRGVVAMTSSAYYSTSKFRTFFDAIYVWAKLSVDAHMGQVSQESLPDILLSNSSVPHSFKW